MREGRRISVIIPALNEAEAIGGVLAAIPSWVDEVIVADNGSTDATAAVSAEAGARVISAGRRGYGAACLRGMEALDRPDIVVFLDGDGSDHPEQMDRLVDPIARGDAQFVVGSRTRGSATPGSLTPQARFGNALACGLLRLFWGVRYTDLGPFRAISYPVLMRLHMADATFGWTVEMQIKAALHRVPYCETAVDYKNRAGGTSKVSGSLRGVAGASVKILWTIASSAFRHHVLPGMRHRELIVFTRYPEPGETKTRLIPALGAEGAADLQRRMTEKMTAAAMQCGTPATVWYTGASEEAMRAWLGAHVRLVEQGEGDLGERMTRAFDDAFDGDADAAITIGIDCPEIDRALIEGAFALLVDSDVVLGPALDGGYYLIGIRADARHKAVPALFQGPAWGTDTVLATTLELAARQDLTVARLAPLEDIDRPEDLEVWERATTAAPDAITVIIPALNEAARIGTTIASALRPGVDVIVVDGGSDDGTEAVASEAGARVVRGTRGRARQLNLGAAKARGGYLVFLHGDSTLPEDFDTHVRRLLADERVMLGAFQFSTDAPTALLRFMGWWANLRARWLGLPYGDQAFFVRKRDFRATGGFAEIPIMDDFEFARRMGRRGRVCIAPSAVVTSARRWKRMGPVRTFFRNQAIVLGYVLGVSPTRLAAFYNRAQGVGDGQRERRQSSP